MIRRLHRPPDRQFSCGRWKRATFVAAGQYLQTFMHVPDGLLQGGRQGFAFFHCKHVMQGLGPGAVGVGPSPRGKLGSQGPHGQRQPSEPEPLFSKFEELSIAERCVVLLLVNPMFGQQPLDQALCVALRDHAYGTKRSMQAWDFA